MHCNGTNACVWRSRGGRKTRLPPSYKKCLAYQSVRPNPPTLPTPNLHKSAPLSQTQPTDATDSKSAPPPTGATGATDTPDTNSAPPPTDATDTPDTKLPPSPKANTQRSPPPPADSNTDTQRSPPPPADSMSMAHRILQKLCPACFGGKVFGRPFSLSVTPFAQPKR
jgi:hypothetical protein